MTNDSLARSYLQKARKRMRVLEVLLDEEAHSDVVREAQELVELALRATLRHVGVEPPKWHDVGAMLLEHQDRFVPSVRADLPRLTAISAWLRKEREFSFYGDIDFIPTERYGRDDGERAIEDARFVFGVAERAIGGQRAA